jgi:hypothetical protein
VKTLRKAGKQERMETREMRGLVQSEERFRIATDSLFAIPASLAFQIPRLTASKSLASIRDLGRETATNPEGGIWRVCPIR